MASIGEMDALCMALNEQAQDFERDEDIPTVQVHDTNDGLFN
jgi:hypothetical protein